MPRLFRLLCSVVCAVAVLAGSVASASAEDPPGPVDPVPPSTTTTLAPEDPSPVEGPDDEPAPEEDPDAPVVPVRPPLPETPAPTTTVPDRAGSTDPETAPPAPPEVSAPELTIDPRALRVDGSVTLQRVERVRADITAQLTALQSQVSSTELALAAATARVARAEAAVERLSARERAAVEALTVAGDELEATAVAAFVAGTDPGTVLWTAADPNELTNRRVIVGVVGEHRRNVVERYEALRAAVSSEVAAASDELATARRDQAAQERALQRLGEEIDGLDGQMEEVVVAYQREVVTATVADLDLPVVAVDAYWRAAAAATCRIPWWILAGVGKVESNHGRYGGRTLLGDGTTYPPIIGIPLDGTRGTARILDTDGGRMDFDTVYDRAVGPMQFIPSTWARWGSDGNGDGVADPHSLYDAAASAARYLCASGRHVLDEDGALDEPAARAVLWSYNRSVPYATQVIDHALRYSTLIVRTPTTSR